MVKIDPTASLDFLCISTTGWDEIWGSRQQIMSRLAKGGHRVLFVERQLGWDQVLRYPQHRRKAFQHMVTRAPVGIQENLWLWQPPPLPPGRYFSNTLNHLGQKRLATQIGRVLGMLDFHKPVLWMYPPQSAALLNEFGERLSVYHCIERFAGDQRGLKKRVMTRQEKRLLSKVDLVLTHSLGLQQLYGSLTRNPIEIVPSAADADHFQQDCAVHPLIGTVPAPRLVVMGTLDSRIDFDLLKRIALSRLDWQLVLVGQLKHTSEITRSLVRLSNVHYLGKQSFEVLPSILRGADIGLIPYRITEMTKFINPLKAYEYLAAGIPIVSTELPELKPLSKWIQIIPVYDDLPTGYSQFIEGIEAALQTDNTALQAERCQAARSFTWDNRVRRIMEIIRAHI